MDFTEQHKINEEFLRRFPLEKLKDMTLEQYTNLNRSDSFCYWLESKTEIIGSIWGGSAYKFGIYQYDNKPKDNMNNRLFDDKYAWYTSLGRTSKEAFETVKKAIISAAEYGREGNLDAIELIKPLAQLVKWKIAFIYSNETIIPYYSLDRLKVIADKMGMGNTKKATLSEIQKFLISKRNGMDIHEYGKMLDDIWKEKEPTSSDTSPKLWMWSGDEKTFASNILEMGSSAKGALVFEDYQTKETLIDAYRKVVGNKDASIPQMYWKFMHEVKVGDVVVVFDTKKVSSQQYHLLFGWGRIGSEVAFKYDEDNPIRRDVEWHKPLPVEPVKETMTKNAFFFHDVSGMEAANIKKLLNIDNASKEEMEPKKRYDEYLELLKTNHNLILTGAPGTGKTYLAKEIAKEMGAEFEFVQFHPSYDYTDFVEGLRPFKESCSNVGFERRDGVFKEFCKRALLNSPLDFYQAYDSLCSDIKDSKVKQIKLKSGQMSTELSVTSDDSIKWISLKNESIDVNAVSRARLHKLYETFNTIEKLKGIQNNDAEIRAVIGGCNSTYYWAVLNEVLLRIEAIPFKPFVFIIDEINRGEISKIFGELFFSIDPGYRGKAGIVKTQYQNMIEKGDTYEEGFYVPENVYILGTMNDIDRSVESMDFAMRRRFAWKEVSAEESQCMLAGTPYEAEAKARMNRLNDAILKIRGLGKAYQIGAAYFRKIKDYEGDFGKLWEYHLEGLLYEYLRGNNDASKQLEQLKNAYDGIE